MNNHAGYAAAVTIRLELLQELARSAYAGGLLPNSVVESGPITNPFSPGTFGANMHVDAPTITITPDRKLLLQLRAWGQLGFASRDTPLVLQEMLIENEVFLKVDFAIPEDPTAPVRHPTLLLSATSVGTALTALDGAGVNNEFVLRRGVEQTTAETLTKILGNGVLDRLTNTLPIAGIATDPRSTGHCVIVPEGIVIGINLPGTNGDRSALRAFGSESLAYSVNPDFVVSGLVDFVDRMRDRFAELAAPAEVGALRVFPIDGALRVRTQFRGDRARLSLRFSLLPTLTLAPSSQLTFGVADVENEGSANSFGDAIVLFFTEPGDNEVDYEARLREEFANVSFPAVSTFRLAGTAVPTLTGKLRSFAPTDEELSAEVRVVSDLPVGEVIIGPTNARAGVTSTYRLRLPIGHMADDARLIVDWSLEHRPELQDTLDGGTTNPLGGGMPTIDLGSIVAERFEIRAMSGAEPGGVNPTEPIADGAFAGGFRDIFEPPTDIFEPPSGRDLSFTTDFSSGPLALFGTVIIHARATRTFGSATEVAFAASLAVSVSG